MHTEKNGPNNRLIKKEKIRQLTQQILKARRKPIGFVIKPWQNFLDYHYNVFRKLKFGHCFRLNVILPTTTTVKSIQYANF